EPAPISAVYPPAPPALDRVVATCLAKDPEERWQAAGDVAKELNWIREGSRAGGASPAGERRGARRQKIARAAAGLLLLAGLYLASELRRSKGSMPRAFHSFLLAPENTTFHSNGDDAAPMALSPDGERAVFGAGGKLWTQSLRTGVAIPLAGADAATFPFRSPDSPRSAVVS